jgi:hypothetical protein
MACFLASKLTTLTLSIDESPAFQLALIPSHVARVNQQRF